MKKARECCLKAETFYLYFSKAANAEAQRLYREAIRLDPGCGRAYADLAYAILHAWLFNWDPNASLDEALQHCVDASKLDDENYYWRWMKADIHLYRREYADAARLYDEAAARIADQAIAEEHWAFRVDRADMLLLTGQAGQAISEVQQAIDQLPAPENWFYWVLAWAYYEAGEYQLSLNAMRRLRTPRNAMRKNVVCNLVALSELAAGEGRADDAESLYEHAKLHAEKFLQEEKSQGITYAAQGDLVFPGLSHIENRLPFKDTSRLQRWKGHLAKGFDGVVQP